MKGLSKTLLLTQKIMFYSATITHYIIFMYFLIFVCKPVTSNDLKKVGMQLPPFSISKVRNFGADTVRIRLLTTETSVT